MNIPGFSTNGLLGMHKSIYRALQDDDSNIGEKIYGVRKYPDWRNMSDAIEKELTARKIEFNPIPWGG